MSMPGFTADASLVPTVGHYREHAALFTTSGLVVPQLDSKWDYNETNDDGSKTHVTVEVYTPFDPESDPGGIFDDDGSSSAGWAGWAISAAQCQIDCTARYNNERDACAHAPALMRAQCFDDAQTHLGDCRDRCTSRHFGLYGVGEYY